MEELAGLSLSQIKNLTQELGWTTKKRTTSAIIQEITEKKIPADQLKQKILQITSMPSDPSSLKKTAKKTKNTKTAENDGECKGILMRIAEIEKKMSEFVNMQAFMMKKISDLEIRLGSVSPTSKGLNPQTIRTIKEILLTQIPSGKTISTDEIQRLKALASYTPAELERAILDLVDQEQFDVSDGQASWKIQNNIALLIRK